MNKIETSTTIVKQTTRKLRIWIEGNRLSACGFKWHKRYTRTITKGVITLKLDDNGPLKVAGRKRGEKELPIIDISLTEIEGFKAGQTVTVTYHSDNSLIIMVGS